MVRTAAQRWLPPSFDPPIPEPEPEIVWPTVEEIEAIREAARREGFDAGREEGFAKGVGEGFTQGFTLSPFSRALRATRPAPIITDGLDVLVQEVMAASTTLPSYSM